MILPLFLSVFDAFDVFCRNNTDFLLENLGKILGIGIATTVCNIRYAGKALLDHCAGILDANGVEILNYTDAKVLFESVGNVLFIIG